MENSLSNYFDKVSVAKQTKQHIRIIKNIGELKKVTNIDHCQQLASEAARI
jgi:hypothetical protein